MSMMMSAINEQVAEFPETTKKQLQLVENMVVNAQSEMSIASSFTPSTVRR